MSIDGTQMPQHGSIAAEMQPAWPAASPAEAHVLLGKDNAVSAGSLETSGSSSGVSGAFNMQAALPHFAGHLEGTRVNTDNFRWHCCCSAHGHFVAANLCTVTYARVFVQEAPT